MIMSRCDHHFSVERRLPVRWITHSWRPRIHFEDGAVFACRADQAENPYRVVSLVNAIQMSRQTSRAVALQTITRTSSSEISINRSVAGTEQKPTNPLSYEKYIP
jgi:hypothetical protein